MKKFSSLNFLFLLMLVVSACSAQPPSAITLTPLGEVVIPYNYSFDNTPVGGLSGLAYNERADEFYVISDDRSELANARYYTFTLHLNSDGKLHKDSIKLKKVTFLKTPEGKRYKVNTIDPEGIAIGPDSLIYVTSEGGRNRIKAPFINAYNKDGTFKKSFTIPDTYWADDKSDRSEKGIRTNLAFESLTLTPDGKTMYAATENALMQDGVAADTASESPSRIIKYDLSTGNVMEEFRYDVDKVTASSGDRGPFAVNGLSDLLALNNEGNLLALERNYVQGQGNDIILYEVQTEDATDIKGVNALGRTDRRVQPVRKTLLADLNEYNITIDNYEGVALGPELPNGDRVLLIVSDNNFSNDQQTVFTAFRVSFPKQ